MQAGGSDMLHAAAIAGSEAGLGICARVHDAIALVALLGQLAGRSARAKQSRRPAEEFYYCPVAWADRAADVLQSSAQLLMALELYRRWRTRPEGAETIPAGEKALGGPHSNRRRVLHQPLLPPKNRTQMRAPALDGRAAARGGSEFFSDAPAGPRWWRSPVLAARAPAPVPRPYWHPRENRARAYGKAESCSHAVARRTRGRSQHSWSGLLSPGAARRYPERGGKAYSARTPVTALRLRIRR
jgi:hypothetical protein